MSLTDTKCCKCGKCVDCISLVPLTETESTKSHENAILMKIRMALTFLKCDMCEIFLRNIQCYKRYINVCGREICIENAQKSFTRYLAKNRMKELSKTNALKLFGRLDNFNVLRSNGDIENNWSFEDPIIIDINDVHAPIFRLKRDFICKSVHYSDFCELNNFDPRHIVNAIISHEP